MRKLFALPLLGLLLAGCSGLFTSKSPPVAEYALAPAVATVTAPAAVPCAAVLRVNTVQAAPPWSSGDLLYTQTPFQVSSFAFHRWAAPPATMLSDALVRAIAASGLYRVVLGPTDPGNGDLTLAIRIMDGPVQNFPAAGAAASPGSSTEAFAFAATLTAADSGQLIASREFSAATSASPNPYGGVVAANQLAGKLIGQLVGWLVTQNTANICAGH